MAKNSDQRAGGFEAENTGGVLSGLLAEEEHLDRRAMFRLGTWGVVSVGAVVVAVLANQSGMKSRRDEIAALDVTRQSQQIQSVAKESQNETRRLAAAIDTLNSDRDRMYSRLTGLEQGLESVTGAIAKQNAAAAAPAAASPAAIPPAAPQPVAQSAAPEPAPVTAPVTTVAAAVPGTEKSASERSRTESKKSIQARAAPVAAVTPAPSDAAPATSATPLMASKSTMGPPDSATGKSTEPKSIEPETPAKPVAAAPPAPATPVAATPAPPAPAAAAAAPATAAPATSAAATPTPRQATTPEPAPEVAAAAPAADKPTAGKDKKDGPDAAPAPQLAVNRTEFGVDVGGANSVGGLRALWRGLLKWRANAALAGLQPILVVKEGNNGLGMQLRLVAGPLSDAAAAAKICASMTANDRHCETTVYDGQRLALKAEDIPTTTESISAKPSAERPSPEKPSDPAAENSASDKSSADKSSADKSWTKPANRQGTRRRYSYAKRSAPVVETPPPPAQTSSLSWFRLRSQ
jgi:hypothetical protein